MLKFHFTFLSYDYLEIEVLQLVILRNDLTWIVTVIKLESSTAYIARNQTVYFTLCF